MSKPIDLEGRVTHDPILRKTKTGKSVCIFTIAMDHPVKGETKPHVSFIDIETWEKLADLCAENIRKGKKIQATGRLKQDRWQDDTGKPRSKIKLVSNQVIFIEPLNSKHNEEVAIES
ncbi:MAG TPA: single-stranded DNA-binding protein [Spirochaetota bacterium]|nr:single-stranded DNA-binding protein [Spirochaetota bacterium]HOM11129.1 single-stranded DNA-binding protein [Spirochaetota bacterium]HPP50893.1 single-stranded DNA-binding protein [Spirochaetota bacterium]HXK65689.1 single-stranded DNA-binding protein [Spirochaetota bacterium]